MISKRIDWLLIVSLFPLTAAGLATVSSFIGERGFFERQIVWVIISFILMLVVAYFDMSWLKRSRFLIGIYIFSVILLASLFLIGTEINGAVSWISFGSFTFQPADFVKIILILILAKYFSRRHIEIANPKHIFVTGLYMIIPFSLIFFQPDFGSAIILFAIWFGMILVAGISKKHLFIMLGMLAVVSILAWTLLLAPYQQQRILNFLNPLQDIQGAGYNAYQSTVAVGSGQFFGKGLGYGTQSRLSFLPEYETDFVFAAFAEEWGFVGALILLTFFGIVMWRLLRMSYYGASNFEVLYSVGVMMYFMSHIVINIGMNMGLLPVTGITLPFLSAGGSHILAEFLAIGIALSFYRNAHKSYREDAKTELIGIDLSS